VPEASGHSGCGHPGRDPERKAAFLQVRLLGDFYLTCNGEPVTDVDTPRPQSLLAYLLLHRNAPQPRHHIAFVLWPDSTETQALTNLRNLLHHLRHALPEADRFLHVDRHTLQWLTDAPFALDVADFDGALIRAEQARDPGTTHEALEEAAALYRGDLLPSCYDDWIVPERERLRQAFAEALARLIGLLEDQRDYRAAISYVRRLLRHDPLRETTYRRLMQLHALINERAEALRAYHRCATVLQRELGVEPSRDTREIYERLLKADKLSVPPVHRPRQAAAATTLVGRHGAWTRLRDTWQAASAGGPRFALVSGEAGIGKTRLAEELIRWADKQGIATATARCYAAEGELAYAPIAAWLRASPLHSIEPVWRSEVARVVPEILATEPDLTPPGPLTEAWQRRRFFEALARAVLGSGQPLLLLIDGLQWCDRGTLEWLHYLLRFDPQARLLIVGTYRPEDVGEDHPLTSLVHALSRDAQATEIELAPLSRAETAILTASISGQELNPELTDCLYRETEGNPMFVEEMVRSGLPLGDDETETVEWVPSCLPRPLPPRVRTAIAARLERLSAQAREILELAATIGREFTFRTLARASSSNEDALIRGLDELWQRGIVREQGTETYDFSHAKLREVAYARLSEARRRLLHRRVAEALEAVRAGDLDRVAAQVAAHYEHAEEMERAVSYYQRAAEVAQRVHADETAARFRQRAKSIQEANTAGR